MSHVNETLALWESFSQELEINQNDIENCDNPFYGDDNYPEK